MDLHAIGVAMKFARAFELIDELAVVLHSYKVDPPPYEIGRRDVPSDSTTYVILKSVTPPGIDVSVRIGEIVHHARSALDHVIASAARDRGLADTARAFPVAMQNNSAERRRCRKFLAGLPVPMIETVLRLQPFQCPNIAPESVDLAVLHELWNTDKHRSLAVTTSAAVMSQVFAETPDGSTILGGQLRVQRLEVGDVLAVFPMADGPLPADTDLMATVAVGVHLDGVPEPWRKLPIIEALERLVLSGGFANERGAVVTRHSTGVLTG